MNWKFYPTYQDSGTQWIGEIPEGWKVYKLKFLLSSLESGKRESGELAPLDEGAFSIGGEHINWNGTLKLDNKRFLSYEYFNSMKKGKIRKDDILLVKDGATIGKTALIKEKVLDKMAVNEHVFILRPNNKLSVKLLYYLIISDFGFEQIKLTETGSAQPGINTTFIDKIIFPISENINEQNHITDFLDSKISEINKIIKVKTKLIELMQEKQNALISNIVTNGLNPNISIKDTNIEWLGEIPKHWNFQRLKYTVKLIKENVDGLETDLPYIGLEHIESWTGKLLTQEMQTIYGKSNSFRTGDVLFGKLRPYLAKVVRTTFKGQCTGELLVMRPQLTTQDYLFYYILSRDFINIVDSSTYGAKMPRANWEFIGNLPILLPPETEQNTITEFLDREIGHINRNMINIQESIEKLSEYRIALISAAVTGKIDLRMEVA